MGQTSWSSRALATAYASRRLPRGTIAEADRAQDTGQGRAAGERGSSSSILSSPSASGPSICSGSRSWRPIFSTASARVMPRVEKPTGRARSLRTCSNCLAVRPKARAARGGREGRAGPGRPARRPTASRRSRRKRPPGTRISLRAAQDARDDVERAVRMPRTSIPVESASRAVWRRTFERPHTEGLDPLLKPHDRARLGSPTNSNWTFAAAAAARSLAPAAARAQPSNTRWGRSKCRSMAEPRLSIIARSCRRLEPFYGSKYNGALRPIGKNLHVPRSCP